MKASLSYYTGETEVGQKEIKRNTTEDYGQKTIENLNEIKVDSTQNEAHEDMIKIQL